MIVTIDKKKHLMKYKNRNDNNEIQAITPVIMMLEPY